MDVRFSQMGINHMSDMTLQEASAKVGGHRNPPGHIPGEDVTSSCGFSAQNANISVGVDWRDRDVLNPVKNQGAVRGATPSQAAAHTHVL